MACKAMKGKDCVPDVHLADFSHAYKISFLIREINGLDHLVL